MCNLSEAFIANHTSIDDYNKTLKYSYLFGKTVTLLSGRWAESNRVMLRNRRVGASATGIVQFLANHSTKELMNWFESGYSAIEKYDQIYSDWFAVPRSIKLTTVKPSGCQVGSTLIPTTDGIFRLEELKQNDNKWQNHNITIYQEKSKNKSTKFFYNGKSETRKIRMDSGIELEATPNHKYKILRNNQLEWVEINDIVIGDIVPFKTNEYDKKENPKMTLVKMGKSYFTVEKQIKQPEYMTEDLAWFLGLYYGDGSNHEKKGIRIAGDVGKMDTVSKVRDIVFELFGIEGIIYTRDKWINNTNKKNADIYFNSVQLLEYLKENNILKEKTNNIEIPKIIRMSSKETILSFIDGYAHADGSFKTNGLSFVTISEKWAKEFTAILRMVGMNSKVREFYSKTSLGKSKQYWISVRKGLDAEERYVSKYKREIRNILKNLKLENFDFDTVISNEKSFNETYDIEVPENNCYLANGYISHNTISLLAGATPGMHYPESLYYIRRIRFAKNSPFVPTLQNAGYKVEPDVQDKERTVVVEFPVFVGENVKTINDVNIYDQLNLASFIQEHWADNSVSVTVTFKKDEAKLIASALDFYQFKLKAVSFLPKLDNDSPYPQMPYEEITEDQYWDMIQNIHVPDFTNMFSEEAIGEKYCSNDFCAI